MIKKADVLFHLARHVGRHNGISARDLARAIKGPEADATDERHIRDAVVELRLEGEHICAHPSLGYYMAASDEELVESCKFLYDRAMTSLQQVAAMRRVSLPDLAGQLHLPT